MAYCQQCAKQNGGEVVKLVPHRTTMALKATCDTCGYVWMDRDGHCADAACKVHQHPVALTDHIEDCIDDDDHEFEDDEDDFDCGLARDGQCSKAGSEECDWSCPNRESELFAGSAAWQRKHSRNPT